MVGPYLGTWYSTGRPFDRPYLVLVTDVNASSIVLTASRYPK